MLRRHLWWLAPLAGAAIAGGVVAAVSFGGGSSSHTRRRQVVRSSARGGSARVPERHHRGRPRALALRRPDPDQTGLGSGIVFDTNGDIVTNNHVVGGATAVHGDEPAANSYRAKLVGRFRAGRPRRRPRRGAN